ncbi:RNA 2',3'-cyclic phosphodiesterase [Massilia sp. YIM B02763]|uniref:RNA 2',3'-cyclic phosphodiesterase n=1 Tax=Massilia sp. YIM B02763 TaxID=3050130 RepID=UPI0025B68CD5|nr:RNA 2',3'-cyclic phosphodiesterase [Massilia sp. YIM B02763]MDN4054041.1 RNA 2',3'-cyclic phosphodiesterase [Massilia sp. YIM B02763]
MNEIAPSPAPSSLRLFLALWPDDAVRAQLRAWRDRWTWPRGAAPVDSAKLHLTLHFLGGVPSERLPDLLDGFSLPFSPFALYLGRAELWHNGIAVLAPHDVPRALLDLHAGLAQSLQDLGLQPEERAYRPHVTMARRARDAAPPQEGPEIVWRADRYALVESRPGVGYTVLREYR